MLFVLHLKSVKSETVVRPICSSLISLKCGVRVLFLFGAGFYTCKIILLYHVASCIVICDLFTAAFTLVKRSF